jgi:glycosyltransferase involved in cell wall biosynthesis
MTTDLPLLSICIPAYNRPTWLRRGLESIAESWGEAVEIIITDDSDHPGAEEIIKEVLEENRYLYEHHEQALGMAQNWNRAVSLAQSKYVIILHDDDFFLPGGVERLLGVLRENRDRHPVILCGTLVVDEQERVMKRQVFERNQFLPPATALIKLFSNSSFVRFPAIVIRRSLFDEVGYFNPDWREPCDLEMWMRLFASHGVYCCPEITVAYRVHSQALTMASFHGQTIKILLDLFSQLSSLGILAEQEVKKCKSLFFHQYILAGAWRQLRRGRWQEFQRVMGLLELPELRGLSSYGRWHFLRLMFTILARGSKV